MIVVMVHHGFERREPAVVIETALLPGEQAPQWRRSIAPVGRSIGLKVINPDFLGFMHGPSRLAEQWRHMARRALRLCLEHRLPSLCSLRVERTGRWCRRRSREVL